MGWYNGRIYKHNGLVGIKEGTYLGMELFYSGQFTVNMKSITQSDTLIKLQKIN